MGWPDLALCQEKAEVEIFVSSFLFSKTTQLLGELALNM